MKYDKTTYIELASEYIDCANNSKYKLHIAFLYNNKGDLICKSINKIGTRSRGAGYSDYTIHAERAVLKMVDYTHLKNATLVVIRVNKLGDIMYSKPCHGCECHISKLMRLYGLKRVFYS
jgi:hypothetical protein